MAPAPLNADARAENIRALAHAAGITADEASARLAGLIAITWDPSDAAANQLAAELQPILGRTIDTVANAAVASAPTLEVVIGHAQPAHTGPVVYVSLQGDQCVMSSAPPKNHVAEAPHRLIGLIAACYAAAAALHKAVGQEIPNPPPDPLIIPYAAIVGDLALLDQPVDLSEAYLAGAGAIGNGFLWAARHVDLRGTLHVVDDDKVSPGNLQRQIWFDEQDLGEPKAPTLVAKVQPYLPGCRLVPEPKRLQEHQNRGGRWLRRLIVGVDSRRARRELQNEMPREVFDASTSGLEEIVLHYNRQPHGFACMGCLYRRDQREITQDELIAEHLGISVDAVRTQRISAEIAQQIVRKHSHLTVEDIKGLAFDTLYKQLCASGRLHSAG